MPPSGPTRSIAATFPAWHRGTAGFLCPRPAYSSAMHPCGKDLPRQYGRRDRLAPEDLFRNQEPRLASLAHPRYPARITRYCSDSISIAPSSVRRFSTTGFLAHRSRKWHLPFIYPRFPISRIFQWKPLEQVIDCYGFQVALPGR